MEKRGNSSQRSNSWQHSPLPYILLILALAFFSNAVQTPSSPTGNPVLRHRVNDTMKCSDSDGYNILLQGQCADGKRTFKDYCLSNNTLVEFTCSNTSIGCMQNVVNCASYGMMCQSGACVLGNQPDYTIINYNITQTPNGTNQSQTDVIISATVKNQGSSTTSTSHTNFRIDGSNKFVLTPGLSAGASQKQYGYFYLTKGKTYTTYVTADYYNTIQESNENNNKINFTFST